MIARRAFFLAWLLLGFFLLRVGADFFPLIPSPARQHIWTSTVGQVFVSYVLLALSFWAVGWRLLQRGKFPDFPVVRLLRQVHAAMPLWVRWAIGVLLSALPPWLIFISPLTLLLSGFWLRAAVLFAAAAMVNILIAPRRSVAEWVYHYFITSGSLLLVYLGVGFVNQVMVFQHKGNVSAFGPLLQNFVSHTQFLQLVIVVFIVNFLVLIASWRFSENKAIPDWQAVQLLQHAAQHIPAWVRWCLALLVSCAPPAFVFFSPFAGQLTGFWPRMLLLLFAALWVNLLVNPRQPLSQWIFNFFIALVVLAAVFLCGIYLTKVTAYPFSLSWSEGNRMWDFSLLFGSGRYLVPDGQEIQKRLSFGREFLWGLPYIFPQINIVGVRFWNVVVRTLPFVAAGGLLLFGRWGGRATLLGALFFGLWAFLFLSQGPILPHLMFSAIIVIIAARFENLTIASMLTAFAGCVAFYSRWHWAYAPGLWAGMIALLQARDPGFSRQQIGRTLRPVVLGISGYFGGQILPGVIAFFYNNISDQRISPIVNPAQRETFDQALLWDRLLPNPTFPPGVILATLWVLVPLLVVLFVTWKKGLWSVNRLQIFGAGFALLAFLAVGLVASVKIGGGGDLHNLDMFLLALVILVASAWTGILKLLRKPSHPGRSQALVYVLLLMPLFYLVTFHSVFFNTTALQLPPQHIVNQSLKIIQTETAKAQQHGEVLFMDQRQLLTFGYVQDVPLVSQYEKKIVMDKALANNAAYFQQFYQDLVSGRFSLIIIGPLHQAASQIPTPFLAEKDAWVQWVAVPLLEYYRPLITLKAVGVQLLVPRALPIEP
ncbi:MAG: hypothetical protein OEZ02_04170 [Anaerolineae bacterium]|nr:hypothetical protein [Anaerolineae bacterium]